MMTSQNNTIVYNSDSAILIGNQVLTKDIIYDLYIVNNRTKKDICELFHCSYFCLTKLLDRLSITKSKSQIQDSIKQSNINKYGVDNCMKLDSCKNKSIQTRSNTGNIKKHKITKDMILQEYISDNISSEEFCAMHGISDSLFFNICQEYGIHKDKAAQVSNARRTFINKYGCASYPETDEFKQSVKQSNFAKYGMYYCQTDECKKRIKSTCMKKYGVEQSCLLPQARRHHKNSSFEIMMMDLLRKHNIGFSREFTIKKNAYDFLICDSNILLEVNPYATHNSSWGVYGDCAKSPDYHLNKTKLAYEHGYICLCFWDWTDPEKYISIINMLRNSVNNLDLVGFSSPRKIVYNYQNHQIVNKNDADVTNHEIEIFDDGIVIKGV